MLQCIVDVGGYECCEKYLQVWVVLKYFEEGWDEEEINEKFFEVVMEFVEVIY